MDDSNNQAFVQSGAARLEFDLARGAYSIFSGERALFTGVRVSVLRRRKKFVERLDTDGPWERAGDSATPLPEPGAGGFALQKREEWGRMLFAAEAADDGALVIRVGLDWDDEGEPPELEAIIPMVVPAGGVWPGRESSGKWRAYIHGWQCWTPTGVAKGSRPGDYLLPLFLPKKLKPMLANPTTPVSSERGRFFSEWFSAIADTEAGDSAVIGFTGVSRMLSNVMVYVGRKPEQSELEARVLLDGVRPERGEPVMSEPLAVIPGDLSCENFDRYVELLARGQGVDEVRRTPAGWCSWYQYFTGIDQGEVRANLDMLSERYGDLGVELVQIDDGYSPAVGDWLEVNDRFGDGMASLAQEIASKGMVPGIWVAPFTVTRKSRVFKDKKDWVQRTVKGRLVLGGFSPDWGGRYYGLDVTHPEVLEWLREVFETLSGYGYGFFKLDFMGCGLLEGKRHDPSLTRAQAARRALEVIREAVGKEAYIMAAGGPVLLGTGILDAQRVSGDVAPFWRATHQTLLRDRATPGVRNSLMNTMTRSFMSGRLFDGDPDCLMTRVANTKLTGPERRTLASAIAVFGGSIMISDNLAGWGDAEVALAAASLPHAHGLPRTPDLWEREVPELLMSKMSDAGGSYRLLLAVNWFDKERDLTIRLAALGLSGRWHACEFWSGEYLGEVGESFTATGVPPHGCALVRLTEATDAPRLIGSNVNLSQGASEMTGMERTADGVSLSVRSPVKCESVLTLSLPDAGQATATLAGGGVVRLERLTTAVYRAKFDLAGSERLSVHNKGD
ncbi:MAG: alpha-galactosidase [Candidatus Geothermincolia bacterium]